MNSRLLRLTLSLTTMLLAGCALNSSNSNSLSQTGKFAPPAKILLNAEDAGSSNDTSQLYKKLLEVFKQRRENFTFKYGMESRTDLTTDERIDREVFVRPERTVQLSEVAKVITAAVDAYASPIFFPIFAESSGPPVKADPTTSSPAFIPGTDKPNPLLLMISLQKDATSSAGGQLIDGIPVVLSGKMRAPDGGEVDDLSIVVMSIPKDGEYAFANRRLEKASLTMEIANRLKDRRQVERALYVKTGDGVSYGTLEDIVYAAKSAGAELIYVMMGEEKVSWEEQGVSLTVPNGWSRNETPMPDTMNWRGPEGARLLVDVLNGREISSPDKELEVEYERRLYLQKQGQFDEVRYLTLDGVKGLFRRSTDKERVTLHWDAFRKHQGKFQYVNVYVSVPLKSFQQRQFELYGILHSIKFAPK
ncbi:MAG: hypothetical protein ABR501_10015 [Pyrinomonadaceae bacterium]